MKQVVKPELVSIPYGAIKRSLDKAVQGNRPRFQILTVRLKGSLNAASPSNVACFNSLRCD